LQGQTDGASPVHRWAAHRRSFSPRDHRSSRWRSQALPTTKPFSRAS
jgi:hypothetical protein